MTVASTAGPAQNVLRRLIVYVLLFALVTITSIGIAGLLERLFTSGSELARNDVAGLAGALAFTLVGGPLTALLWWFVWRRLDDAVERAAPGWGLYLAGMYAVSLIVTTTGVLSAATSLLDRSEPRWHSPLSAGLVWGGVWLWHRWMWRHRFKRPTNLEDVPAVIGTVFGLFLGTGAFIATLGGLLDVAIRGYSSLTPGMEPWWQAILKSLLWAVGGALIWWWHWIREGGRRVRTGFMNVVLIGAGVFAAGLTALAGFGVVLFVLLRLAFDRSDSLARLLEPLGPSLAAAVVGALVWRYHRNVAAERSPQTQRASLLVTSGASLAAAAAGIGIIVNATLAAMVSPLAGNTTRTLLLGGISSLVVGGPVWWRAWRPLRRPQTADDVPPGRRVYLVVFFGISALVALIALLVIGYRLFEFVLGDVSGGSLVDRVRAPFGVLVAAGLVAGYHFGAWRHDHSLLGAVTPKPRSIGHVTLVTASHAEELSQAVTRTTGARVTVWTPADGALGTSDVGEAEAGALIGQVTKALEGITAGSVLLVVGGEDGAGTRTQVIPFIPGSGTR